MPRSSAPWTVAMLERLATGPTEREELVRAAMRLVPPSRALRVAEKNRQTWREGWERREGRPSPGISSPARKDPLLVGARHVVNSSLKAMQSRGRVVIEDGTVRLP